MSRLAAASRFRGVVLLVLGAALTVATGLDAAVRVFGRSAPSLALRLRPGDARALDNAFTLALTKSPATIRFASWAAQARLGLRSTGLDAGLVRIVSTDPALPQARSRILLTLSEHVSRRDPLGQLALIEAAVGAGRVDQALTHYDRALSVSPDLRNLLFPVLYAAIDGREVRAGVAMFARRNKPWMEPFVAYATRQPGSQIAVANLLLAVDHGPAAWPLARHYEGVIAGRFAAAGDLDQALTLGKRSLGRNAAALDRVDLSPAAWTPALHPLTWTPSETEEISAERDRDGVLITATAGTAGRALTRQTKVSAGRYRLQAAAAPTGDAAPLGGHIALNCLGAKQATTLREVPIGPAARRVDVLVDVPVRCAAVQVDVSVDNGDQSVEAGMVLRNLSLRRTI